MARSERLRRLGLYAPCCTRSQLIRSVFEGVALAVRDSWDGPARRRCVGGSDTLTGGGSTDTRWQQLLADILEVPLVPAHDLGNATIGAPISEGMAAGHWRSIEDIPFPDHPGSLIEPGRSRG
ncbi:hypothetical protein F2981_01640 [Sinorhizobium meliloti]|nr:hypothetical protein [Sinorhizobium meliloti]